MRGFKRATIVVFLAVAFLSVTCAFPTDKSNELFVTVHTDSGKFVVLAGQKLPAHAALWQRVGTDSVEIKNVVFQWSTDNDSIAIVRDEGYGDAAVTGIASGQITLSARPVAFEKAQTAYTPLRVSKPLEVDSVRPSLVRYGDTITVYGIGVDSIFLASLHNATQFDYPLPFLLPTRSHDSTGYSTATFWVTPVAHSDRLSFIGPGVFGSAPDSTKVVPVDILEPNEVAPRSINLDAPARFPLLPQIKFLNPALAFEDTKRGDVGVDWYRFGQTTARDLTIILSAPDVRGTFSTFLSDSLVFVPGSGTTGPQYNLGPSAWTDGPQSHDCRGQAFEPPETQPESTIVALRGMPAGRLHALSLYSQPGRYGLAVIEGYVTSDPTVPRDKHEEDDFCDAADARGLAVTLPAGSVRDTLTIDNPHDVDWIRFRVTSLTTVTIQMASITSALAADSSDIDLYLLTVPGGGASSTLDLLAKSDSAGSSESISTILSAGDYYLVAVDYQGVPVIYQLCISTTGCAGFPSGPAAGPFAASVALSGVHPIKRPPATRARRVHVP